MVCLYQPGHEHHTIHGHHLFPNQMKTYSFLILFLLTQIASAFDHVSLWYDSGYYYANPELTTLYTGYQEEPVSNAAFYYVNGEEYAYSFFGEPSYSGSPFYYTSDNSPVTGYLGGIYYATDGTPTTPPAPSESALAQAMLGVFTLVPGTFVVMMISLLSVAIIFYVIKRFKQLTLGGGSKA